MVSFTSLFAAGSVIAGALALPTSELTRRGSSLLKREQGTNNGFFYQYWTSGSGTSTYTNGAAGEYSTTWNDIGDFTAGKGWATGSNRTINFSGTFNPGTNGYLSVYTWSTSVETYILENYGPYNPGSSATHMGTVTTDGASYDIYRDYPGTNPSDANFVQYWSIRSSKRSSGTVTTANHYNAWNKLGMTYDPSGSYQIVSTEGFGSTGSSSITVSEGSSDSSSSKSASASSTKKAAPTSTKKAAPTSTKKAVPTSTKKAVHTSTKKAAPTSTKKVVHTSTKKAAPTSTKKAVHTSTKKVVPTTTKKAVAAESSECSVKYITASA